MADIILITGGSRSGKSSYAEKRAEEISRSRFYIATCPRIDDEIAERIKKHREARRNKDWETVEEQVDLVGCIGKKQGRGVILVDCLTLWINNILYRAQQAGTTVDEETIYNECNKVIHSCKTFDGTVLFVTNEVGLGIVPESPQARLYRDCVGKCNQVMANAAKEVILVSCGIPLTLKQPK